MFFINAHFTIAINLKPGTTDIYFSVTHFQNYWFWHSCKKILFYFSTVSRGRYGTNEPFFTFQVI